MKRIATAVLILFLIPLPSLVDNYLFELIKKEYSDWMGRNIEIMVMVANDGKIFRFSGTAECISLSPWEIKRTLAYNGHIIADIIVCVHNHNKNEDFSPEDRKFYRWLKVNGFKGRFMIYYPLRQAFKELKD